MNRSAMREIAFQFLYGAEIQKELQVEQIETFLESNEIKEETVKQYVENVVSGIVENQAEITKTIEQNLKAEWKIERVSKTNLALLKLAIFEIKYEDLPYKAIINEVVELAKKYGEENDKLFINGVLATVVKEKNNGETKE